MCDRCKRHGTYEKEGKDFECWDSFQLPVGFQLKSNLTSVKRMELCEECLKSLIDWVNP